MVKPTGQTYVYVSAWRGRGAPQIGAYTGATLAAVREAMRADAAGLAARYAEARQSPRPTETLAQLLDRYEESVKFGSVAASTQTHRARAIAKMKADVDPVSRRPFASMPAAALGSTRTHAVFLRWRDVIATTNGHREADYRIETLKAALSWAVKHGLAKGNPALGILRLSNADRSELIWEPQHIAAFLGHVRSEIARVWAAHAPDDPRRAPQILRLAAARDTLVLALNTGMRRENLSTHKWAELQPPAIVYTALKGARRAKSAGKKSKPTILPILEDAARVYARRREATGHANPWIITSARGGRYTPDALGANIYEITALLGIARTLHDAKGTFVTRLLEFGIFTTAEIAEMVDWSEDEVETIKRRYVSAPAIASAMIERLRRRKAT